MEKNWWWYSHATGTQSSYLEKRVQQKTSTATITTNKLIRLNDWKIFFYFFSTFISICRKNKCAKVVQYEKVLKKYKKFALFSNSL